MRRNEFWFFSRSLTPSPSQRCARTVLSEIPAEVLRDNRRGRSEWSGKWVSGFVVRSVVSFIIYTFILLNSKVQKDRNRHVGYPFSWPRHRGGRPEFGYHHSTPDGLGAKILQGKYTMNISSRKMYIPTCFTLL